jgi:hypothetical protein
MIKETKVEGKPIIFEWGRSLAEISGNWVQKS